MVILIGFFLSCSITLTMKGSTWDDSLKKMCGCAVQQHFLKLGWKPCSQRVLWRTVSCYKIWDFETETVFFWGWGAGKQKIHNCCIGWFYFYEHNETDLGQVSLQGKQILAFSIPTLGSKVQIQLWALNCSTCANRRKTNLSLGIS